MSGADPTTRDAASIYLDRTYLGNNPTWHADDSAWKAQQVYRMLSKHGTVARTIGEVGCGAGEILRQLAARYPLARLYGYEPSPDAYALCAARQSPNIRFFNESVFGTEERFDVMLCIDVMEHVEDYIGFLRSLRQRAERHVFHIPLDVNVVSVMSGHMMRARRSVGHLHYFTPETALATLEDSGFEVVDHFFTTGFYDLPARSLKTKLAKLPKKLAFSVAPNLSVRLFGGCSLLVLAK